MSVNTTGILTLRWDFAEPFDPRVVGFNAVKGAIFRYVPDDNTNPVLLMKQDAGFTTNWVEVGAGGSTDTASNLGAGAGLFAQKVAGDFEFKSLVAGPNITITPSADEVEIGFLQAPFVYYVGAGLEFSTIQAAIDQAQTDGVGPGQPGIINIAPGLYTENLTFIANLTLQAFTQNLAILQVTIDGQHTYTPPVNADPLSVQLNFRGLSFNDNVAGNTLSFIGPNGAIITIAGCQFVKGSATGSAIVSNMGVVSVASSNFFSGSSDYLIDAQVGGFLMLIDLCTFNQGATGGFLQSAVSAQFFNSQCVIAAPSIFNVINNSTLSVINSIITNPDPNANIFTLAAGCEIVIYNSTLELPTGGTGFVVDATGPATLQEAGAAFPSSSRRSTNLTITVDALDPVAYTYFVGADQIHKTIQSAIDAGVADGVDGINIKGTINIYPGTYVENLNIAPGFCIQSIAQTADGWTRIQGNHTYSPTGVGSPDEGRSTFVGISFYNNTPGDMFTCDGVGAQGILHFYQASLVLDAPNGRMIVQGENDGSGSLFFLIEECVIQGTSADPEFDVYSGGCYFYNSRCFFSLGTLLRLNNASQCQMNYFDCNGANASNVINILDTAQAQIFFAKIFNGQANQNAIAIAAGAVCTITNSVINQPGGGGFAMAGSGTLNTGGNTYMDNSTKEGTLTVNTFVGD